MNGTSIPLVDWDLGESYAGQIPISKESNETRQLFFWYVQIPVPDAVYFATLTLIPNRYFPSTNPDASEEVTIW